MRLLAVDLGDKRTGLASGDTETGTVFPIETLHVPRGDALLQAVCTAATDHAADAIVIGLPLNMDNTEGPRAAISRSFGEEVASRTGLPVHFQDERLTSFEADMRLRGQSTTHGNDAMAALVLLEEYLSQG
ncbi:MAG: Holliday junction resolvase RuvX [Phycisphaerales bacterium]|jgi:putative Holliday junction resolvase|nr:Holliday junction resolvase RuvX [Phycisphaerales bacterium]